MSSVFSIRRCWNYLVPVDRAVFRENHLLEQGVSFVTRHEIKHHLLGPKGTMVALAFKVFWIIERHAQRIREVNRLSRIP